MKKVPIMPKEYQGKFGTSGGFTKTKPRKWTKAEINWCLGLRHDGYNTKDISVSVDRTEVSVSKKFKRLLKETGNYNTPHKEDKYKTNEEFLNIVNPKSILDVFAGISSYYTSWVTTNDKNKEANTEYHMDALKCICKLYSENNKYDLIDLDPYGTAYDCFDLAIKMAKKGLIITLGEMGHKRFRRLDFVKRHYGIETFEDFTVDNLIKKIQIIGERNRKTLKVWKKKEWRNIARVYFTIEPFKIIDKPLFKEG